MRISSDKMRRLLYTVYIFLLTATNAGAQDFNQLTDDGTFTQAGSGNNFSRRDSVSNNKEIPKGLKTWTVDELFGDRKASEPDTLSYMYMNTVFTTGLRGEYNTTGNLGAPRINRIFIDRALPGQFMFTQPYDGFFITPVNEFNFTNTLSPITNISYDECGDKLNGEDHLKAIFGVNAGKRIGLGFKFDYIYGRGYYQNQSTSHFNYTMYGSYLGDRYQAHLLMSTNHQKVAENGGISDDMYITHPETFEEDFMENEIPTVLEKNWNRNDNQHIFLSHRYNLGFNRKVKMTDEEIKAKKFAMESQKENDAAKEKAAAAKKAKKEGRDFNEEDFDNKKTFGGRPEGAKIAGDEPIDSTGVNTSNRISINGNMPTDSIYAAASKENVDTSWMKNEYVPVTSFIHTMKFDNYRRIYEAYSTPADYYLDTYNVSQILGGDSIYDKTKHYELRNTFAIALLEGFNKWAKSGLKAFISSDLRHFTMSDSIGGISTYNEHNISVGGQLSKTEGKSWHYNVLAETWIAGEDAGQLKVDANIDINIPMLGDTLKFEANGFFYRLNPTFYQRHYHAKHAWWDNDDMAKEIRTRIEGRLSFGKTRTTLRAAMDNIKNYTFFAQRYTITDDFMRVGNTVNVNQCSENVNLLTLQLGQNFKFGPLYWDNMITYQKSSKEEILPVPTLNIYSNLFFRLKIAKVLKVDLGADIRYFTKYYAPDYSPMIGQFTVQNNGENNIEIGNYPIINVYANMHLKQTRFFVMMSHVNASSGGEYFYAPHYPLNKSVLRFGVSWNFFN